MILEFIIETSNYIAAIILLMIGLWAMIAKRNLIKKIIGMTIMQTAIILFYISMGAKNKATIPILDHHDSHHVIQAIDYANPLTQILMLTAIVVGVATLGVALGLIQKVYKAYGTIEEDELLAEMRKK